MFAHARPGVRPRNAGSWGESIERTSHSTFFASVCAPRAPWTAPTVSPIAAGITTTTPHTMMMRAAACFRAMRPLEVIFRTSGSNMYASAIASRSGTVTTRVIDPRYSTPRIARSPSTSRTG